MRDELNDEKTTENPHEIEEHCVELKSRSRMRMFVKVDGARTSTMEMALSDKV